MGLELLCSGDEACVVSDPLLPVSRPRAMPDFRQP